MSEKKILVADDDPGIIDVMQILLQDEGYKVITTMNGENIFELCKQKPDLIFLDIWMAGMDGNIICKELKENDETKYIPVVMFSANRDTKEISIKCGADDFLAKPFEIDALLNIVHKFL